ncbi:MAG: biotin/lipoyl-containing protein [Halanaerobiales bacterium]
MKKYIVEVNNNEYEVTIKEEGEITEGEVKNTDKEKDINNNTRIEKDTEDTTADESISDKDSKDKVENINKGNIDSGDNEEVTAPMSGKILSIKVNEGDEVDKNQILMTLEAMKMETEIVAPVSGEIKQITADEGGKCKQGDILALIEAGGN